MAGCERDDRVAEATARVTATGFDLAAEWPVRAALLRLAEAEHLLAWCLHHIACDAPVHGGLSRELAELYARRAAGGEPSPLPRCRAVRRLRRLAARPAGGERLERTWATGATASPACHRC